MQFPAAAASSPTEGVTGDQETATTGDEDSAESSNTWRKIGPMSVSCWESGEGM